MSRAGDPPRRNWWRQLAGALLVVATASVGLVAHAAADGKRFSEEPFEVGFFYGTFGESPNTFLLVGGTVEEFCEAGPDGGPGTATAKIRERKDGTTRVKVKSWNQPMYLYEADIEGVPPWLDQVCGTYFTDGTAPEPFASGSGFLKVRDTIHSPDYIEVFNKVRGYLHEPDGTKYKVRASADFVLRNGVPDGDPEDFVSFSLRKLRWKAWW
ncbi:MAG: hypothetical protein AAF480_11050 [Actinomycetota bacterium]